MACRNAAKQIIFVLRSLKKLSFIMKGSMFCLLKIFLTSKICLAHFRDKAIHVTDRDTATVLKEPLNESRSGSKPILDTRRFSCFLKTIESFWRLTSSNNFDINDFNTDSHFY
jgi:hypothetical protein